MTDKTRTLTNPRPRFIARLGVAASIFVAVGCGSSVEGGGGGSGGGSNCGEDTDCISPASCTVGGVEYAHGETVPGGCADCTCSDGEVLCPAIECAVTCVYEGTTYVEGESFPSTDGCNTCTCDLGGNVACTEKACVCDPEAEWWREYVADSPSACEVIDYACPINTTAFSNDCGCGCEQDASCPEWFDCMPPTECDPEQIAIDCPYSGIAY